MSPDLGWYICQEEEEEEEEKWIRFPYLAFDVRIDPCVKVWNYSEEILSAESSRWCAPKIIVLCGECMDHL